MVIFYLLFVLLGVGFIFTGPATYSVGPCEKWRWGPFVQKLLRISIWQRSRAWSQEPVPLKSGALCELQRLHTHDAHPGWQRRGGEGTRHTDISFAISMGSQIQRKKYLWFWQANINGKMKLPSIGEEMKLKRLLRRRGEWPLPSPHHMPAAGSQAGPDIGAILSRSSVALSPHYKSRVSWGQWWV